MTIIAYDSENVDAYATANVTIAVKRNENSPKFNTNFEETLLETVPIGQSVLTLLATDDDQVIHIRQVPFEIMVYHGEYMYSHAFTIVYYSARFY